MNNSHKPWVAFWIMLGLVLITQWIAIALTGIPSDYNFKIEMDNATSQAIQKASEQPQMICIVKEYEPKIHNQTGEIIVNRALVNEYTTQNCTIVY